MEHQGRVAQRGGVERAIDGQDPVGVGRHRSPGVVEHALDSQPEDQREAAVPGLVLHVVAREVAQREGVAGSRARLDVLHQAGQVAEVGLREGPVGHLGAVHEIDLVAWHVAVEDMIPDRVFRGAVARDDVARARVR